MAVSYSIFISSVQKELAEERRAVKNIILNEPLLRHFVRDVFLFEDFLGKRQTENYKEFREMSLELVDLSLDLAKLTDEESTSSMARMRYS